MPAIPFLPVVPGRRIQQKIGIALLIPRNRFHQVEPGPALNPPYPSVWTFPFKSEEFYYILAAQSSRSLE
jgi:hypothetical protein